MSALITETIETDLGPVEFTAAGAGEPILYFHGTGITGQAMARLEASLADAEFQLLVPSRPGYGGTPLSNHRSTSACADLAAALLDALGIETVSVMGASGGAAFAASFAITHAARTRALVLLCPQLHRWNDPRWAPRGSRWTLPLLKMSWTRKLLLKLYSIQVSRGTVDQLLRMEAGERYASVCDDAAARELGRETLSAMPEGVKCPGFENDFLVFLGEDVLDSKSQLGMPTLVLHDPCDPMAPVDHVRWFSSLVPHCECVELEAAGHLVWLGPDAAVMQQTRRRFLQTHSRSGPV